MFKRAAAVVLTAAALLLLSGAFGGSHQFGGYEAKRPDPLAGSIERAQQRLTRLPGDWVTWASLGVSYVEQARVTGDPTLYQRAETALTKSQQLHANADALAGLGSLANSRHDFAAAARLAREALVLNPHSATAYGVLADALTQLGEMDAATDAVQRMLDLDPSLPALSRAAYDLEQHGLVTEARELWTRALRDANGANASFVHEQLGDLAWHENDLATARVEYLIAGSRLGLARVDVAQGHTSRALATYASLASSRPTPSLLAEYAMLLPPAQAAEQLALADATLALLAANGGADDLAAAEVAIARGLPCRRSVVRSRVAAPQAHRCRRPARLVAAPRRARLRSAHLRSTRHCQRNPPPRLPCPSARHSGGPTMIGVVLSAAMALVPAHPLGNFSVNQLVSLSLHPDRVAAVAIVDLAELPTLQFTPSCDDVARDVAVTIDGKRLHWTLSSTRLDREPGAAGLDTTRLTCELTAPATLDRPTDIEIVNGHLPERLGWRELTATGDGVTVTGLPSASVTNQLRSYPDDLLSSPLDVRSAHLRTTPGFSSNDAVASVGAGDEGVFARAEQWLQNTVGDKDLTPLVGLLAVLLAMVLGAGHAALPGHGKTVMAIYLAGRAGRPRDALMVGATVTATHTGGVLVLGLLLTGFAGLAGEAVLGWLGIVSGALVMAVGGFMLFTTLRAPVHRHHHHDHGHTHHHHANLTALGVAGGLVPSPSALIVLLGAIALGRTGFGVLLVLAYGLGMAGALTIAGLTLLKVRDRLQGRWQRLTRLAPATPYATGGLVLIVGIGLAARAATLVA